MTWLTLRQHRLQIGGMLAIAVLLAIALVFAADYAARVRTDLGVDTCAPLPNTNFNCEQLDNEWRQRVGSLNFLFYALYLLPGLVASYVGGPLFAVEFERGTHRLAWTQSISRLRWAATKLGLVLLVVLAVGIILAPFGGGQRVFNGDNSRRPFETFEIEGPAFVSYFVFGLAAGAFVGAWSRRLVTGMFVGLLIFAVVRVGVHNLRPAYQEPATAPFASYQTFPYQTPNIPPDAWILGVKGFDLEGRPVADTTVTELVQEYFRTSGGISTSTRNDTTFLLDHGVVRRQAYQPAERFWTFQWIEAAIFTGLAALFAALTLWRVKTRDA
jgi:ABC-type transport system involved in multi-copper enzyme maturation permease subunit